MFLLLAGPGRASCRTFLGEPGAAFSGAAFSGAAFSGAAFSGAALSGAGLSGAALSAPAPPVVSAGAGRDGRTPGTTRGRSA